MTVEASKKCKNCTLKANGIVAQNIKKIDKKASNQVLSSRQAKYSTLRKKICLYYNFTEIL